MIILDKMLHNKVWNDFESRIGFYPDSRYREHRFEGKIPFLIYEPYLVFSLDKILDVDVFQEAVNTMFIEITKPSDRLYVLDWQHTSYTYNPRNPWEMKDILLANDGFDDYNYYFPTYWPNGDYYFFLAEDMSFGWLGHPWRHEIWVYGEPLLSKMKEVYKDLNLELLYESTGEVYGMGWIRRIKDLLSK